MKNKNLQIKSLKNRITHAVLWASKIDELEFDVTVLEPLPKHLPGIGRSTSNNRLPYMNPRLAYFSSFYFFLSSTFCRSNKPIRNFEFFNANEKNRYVYIYGFEDKPIDSRLEMEILARNLRSVISDTNTAVFAFQVMWISGLVSVSNFNFTDRRN